jgi:hypothetical protein
VITGIHGSEQEVSDAARGVCVVLGCATMLAQ